MKLTKYLKGMCTSLIILVAATVFTSCKKSKSDIGAIVFKETKNKIFKDIDADVFAEKFKIAIEKRQARFKDLKSLNTAYKNNEYQPVILIFNLPKGKLKETTKLINNSTEHGLDPGLFKVANLNESLNKVYDKMQVQSLDAAYQVLIDLELAAAYSISRYSDALQFGIISPRRIFAQYYTTTPRPDSISFAAVFRTKDVVSFLDSIQPKNAQYQALQKALKIELKSPIPVGKKRERVIKVNLERLRWKNLPTEDKYVWVNIPDFKLNVIENGKSTLNMKVCVGEGRNMANHDQLIEYDENDLKKDRPFNRETPQLKSLIHSVQVNPIWNIPESIATNEITKFAASDPYYLANNNIDVFLDGKKIEDPETIDWSAAGVGKTYRFKQRPGEENSLGRIKFLFNNQSSVYLHDTPNKLAFNKDMRAVSHGCVRVEKPLELAAALFGNGQKYELIKSEMVSESPKVKDVALSVQIPIYLSYFTCWADENGDLQFRKDVYGLDVVLYSYMQRTL